MIRPSGRQMPEHVIPYVPRRLWRDVIHPALDRVRYATLVCHRRFGKTVGIINQMIKMAWECTRPSPRYGYFAPYRTQAKTIAFDYLLFYTSVIPGISINRAEMVVELPTRYIGRPGAKIYVGGADKPDNLRGMYFDGIALDEYGNMRRSFYNEVIRPAIADRKGFVWKLGTPRGKDAFYESYLQDRDDPERFACLYTVEDSGVIDPEELAAMKADMTPDAIRQELYCDFEASAGNILITIDLAAAAAARRYGPLDVPATPRVMGIDVARFGDDRTVIVKRQGLVAYEPVVIQGQDNMTVADIAAQHIDEFRPQSVFVDGGRGEGVIDRLRRLGYNVVEAVFNARPMRSDRYANRRAEMWDAMRRWMSEGGSLPACADLVEEVSYPTYSFDSSNRLVLEKKEKVKERLGKSPDIADALALTFFAPVADADELYEYESGDALALCDI